PLGRDTTYAISATGRFFFHADGDSLTLWDLPCVTPIASLPGFCWAKFNSDDTLLIGQQSDKPNRLASEQFTILDLTTTPPRPRGSFLPGREGGGSRRTAIIWRSSPTARMIRPGSKSGTCTRSNNR